MRVGTVNDVGAWEQAPVAWLPSTVDHPPTGLIACEGGGMANATIIERLA